MKISKYKRWLVGFAMLLVGTMAHADGTPFAYNAPGVGDPSFPLFLGTNDTISVKKNGHRCQYLLDFNGHRNIFNIVWRPVQFL